jgi:hypothetical protein
MFPRTVLVLVCVLSAACSARDAAREPVSSSAPVVVQGAMDIEINKLAAALDDVKL